MIEYVNAADWLLRYNAIQKANQLIHFLIKHVSRLTKQTAPTHRRRRDTLCMPWDMSNTLLCFVLLWISAPGYQLVSCDSCGTLNHMFQGDCGNGKGRHVRVWLTSNNRDIICRLLILNLYSYMYIYIFIPANKPLFHYMILYRYPNRRYSSPLYPRANVSCDYLAVLLSHQTNERQLTFSH